MGDGLSEVIAAHEATNAELQSIQKIREAFEATQLGDPAPGSEKWFEEQHGVVEAAISELEMSRARVAELEAENKNLLANNASLHEQVATLTKDVEDAKEENSSHAVNRRAEREMFGRQLDAAKADAARLFEIIADVACDLEVINASAHSDARDACLKHAIEITDIVDSADSAAWLESKIAERTTALQNEYDCYRVGSTEMWEANVESLEASLVTARNDAARAELRARDLAMSIRKIVAVSQGVLDCSSMSLERATQFYDRIQDARALLAASTDSDERLREVMVKVEELARHAGWCAALGVKDVNTPIQVIDEVLRGGA